MSFIYYNPDVMEHPATATLSNVRVADAGSRMTQFRLRMYPAYASRELAMRDDIGGSAFFYEDGVLYEADRRATFQYRPCTKVECNYGINWHTYYAQTVEALEAYVRSAYGRELGVMPLLNPQGLFEVQIHVDGRCR